MARFDVYQLASDKDAFVVDIQADLLSHLSSRAVIPLFPVKGAQKETLPRLKPMLVLNGKTYLLITTDIGTIEASALGPRIGSLEDQHFEIMSALDFLFQGF